MNERVFRNLNSLEKEIIKRLVDAKDGYECLYEDLDVIKVEEMNDDGTMLELHHPKHDRPLNEGVKPWSVEGVFVDSDGYRVFIYLFLDSNNNLCQLEYCKEDGSEILSGIDPAKIKLII